MFTLKLFKRMNGQSVNRTVAIHHVQTMGIGSTGRMLELWAFHDQEPAPYDVYYIGEGEPDMTALHYGNHWGWGLLENADGKTTEHYRPAGWGWDFPISNPSGETQEKVAA